MNEAEKKIIRNIEEFGCHVTSVFDPKGDEPNFTYSTGISNSYSAPELIIVGLDSQLSHTIINLYAERVENGEKYNTESFYLGFLSGFEVCFRTVSSEHKKSFMLSSCWLYGNNNFEAIQLIFPTTSGVWPWEPEASESFKELQSSLQNEPAW